MDAAKIDLPMLLYMGSIVRAGAGAAPEATACAEAFPQFPLIVAVDDSDLARSIAGVGDRPQDRGQDDAGDAGLQGQGGRRGRRLSGEPARQRRSRPFELRYQLVEMTADFATPKDQEKGQPLLTLMEEYTKELKDQNYLGNTRR